MNTEKNIWPVWAHKLHRLGLQEWAASFLEAAGPLTLLGAQLIYLGQPVFNQFVPAAHLEALTELLEEPGRSAQFVTLLREESSREPA